MSIRFVFSVLFLLASGSLVAYGLFGNQIRIYDKPDPRDDQVNLPIDSSKLHNEIYVTDLISKERIRPDGFGHLIDLEVQAECFS
jgi:hypothetical protein